MCFVVRHWWVTLEMVEIFSLRRSALLFSCHQTEFVTNWADSVDELQMCRVCFIPRTPLTAQLVCVHQGALLPSRRPTASHKPAHLCNRVSFMYTDGFLTQHDTTCWTAHLAPLWNMRDYNFIMIELNDLEWLNTWDDAWANFFFCIQMTYICVILRLHTQHPCNHYQKILHFHLTTVGGGTLMLEIKNIEWNGVNKRTR